MILHEDEFNQRIEFHFKDGTTFSVDFAIGYAKQNYNGLCIVVHQPEGSFVEPLEYSGDKAIAYGIYTPKLPKPKRLERKFEAGYDRKFGDC